MSDAAGTLYSLGGIDSMRYVQMAAKTTTIWYDNRMDLFCLISPCHRNRPVSFYISNIGILLLLLVCVSFTIIGQPRNSVLIRRV